MVVLAHLCKHGVLPGGSPALAGGPSALQPHRVLPSLLWVLGLTSAQGEETPVLFLSALSTTIRNNFKWKITTSICLAFKAQQRPCKLLSCSHSEQL